MRLPWLLVVLMLCFHLAADTAHARKKSKRRSQTRQLSVVVLPAEGMSPKAATELKEALELELELVDSARVEASDLVQEDLAGVGRREMDSQALSRILQKRRVDVLIRAEKTGSGVQVQALGSDGKPRLIRDLQGSGTDEIVRKATSALKPALKQWGGLKPIKTEDSEDEEVAVRPSRRVGADVDNSSLFVDEEDLVGTGKKPKAAGQGDKPKREDPAREARADARNGRDVVDGGKDDERTRRSLQGDEGESRSAHGSIDDTDEAPSPAVKSTHLLAVSAGFDGSTWQYRFDGLDGVAGNKQTVGATFFPGVAVHADVWPLDWLGVDVAGTASFVRFLISGGGNLLIKPDQFTSLHLNIGAAAKARYLLQLGGDGALIPLVGIGGRIGYRYWSADVEPQVIADTGDALTLVPGFTLHALTIGPEVYLPVAIGGHRLELEARLDILPATFYSESPDNPGATSLAFGYAGELLTRMDLFYGLFAEASVKSTGLLVTFEGAGNRSVMNRDTGALNKLQGGEAINITAGFSASVGFFF